MKFEAILYRLTEYLLNRKLQKQLFPSKVKTMLEEVRLNFPTTKLEELRCTICKGYLSSSPIRVLRDGNCICGDCSALNGNSQAKRVLQFEAILSEVLFPCQFVKNGCMKKLLFNSTSEHESTCDYRMFACPTLKPCTWQGFCSQLHGHFAQMHADLNKEKAEFKIVLGQDMEEVFTFSREDFFFIFKYQYNEESLTYDIRCSLKTEHDIFYKIQLINDSNVDCSLDLKLNKCLPFDNNFYALQKVVTLNLNRFLEVLEYPSSIVILITLKVVKGPSKNSKRQANQAKLTVNYDLLDSVRCIRCQNYLIAPLFVVPLGTVCYDCSKGFVNPMPALDTKLINLVAKLNYPCPWYGCNFVGKGHQIKIHRLSCSFRSYKCFVPQCNASLNLASVANHVQVKHSNAQYSLKYVYKTSFSAPYGETYACTIKDDTLLTFRHTVFFGLHCMIHSVLLYSDLTEITVSVQFEHQHCKLKSKPFVLVSNVLSFIELMDLPSCFNSTEELLVVIYDPPKKIVKPQRKWWFLVIASILLLGFVYYVVK